MNNDALADHIKSCISVSPAELQIITSAFTTETLSKGAFYSQKGSDNDRLGFICQGYIRFYIEANDREVTQWISGPGQFVADAASLMLHQPARWDIQALTECVIQSVTGETYHNLRSTLPVWSEFDRLLLVKCFAALEDRIFRHLYMTTEERFQYLVNTQPELFNFVPLQYLASMMGMTPETLSRLRKKVI
jgi:CRP-like cAMP-binding protein